MPPTRRRYLAAAAGAIAIAGCQSGPNDSATSTDEGDNGGGAPNTATDGGAGAGPTVQVREQADHGEILVDGDGMTLYMFDSDTQGDGASTCSGGCLDTWPPLTVDGEATAGDGVSAELTTFDRGDGDTQVVADGWPLYYFASDGSPGDVAGQGVQDVWWVLDPAGEPIRATGGAGAETEDETGQAGPY